MTAIDEMTSLMDDETLLYRDIKTQYADYEIKKVTVWSTNEEFLYGLLYDLGAGHVFGPWTVVEILLLAEEDQVTSLEVVFCCFSIGGLPKIKDLKISSCLEDMKNSDYLILHHEVDWGPQTARKSRMEIIKEQFALLRLWGKKINECLRDESLVLLIGDCLSPTRLVLALYSPDLSQERIHGVTRHYERAATSLIASKLKVPMREVKGVGVFGEDIVETTNTWLEEDMDDHQVEDYHESLRIAQPELYHLMKIAQKYPGKTLEQLQQRQKPRNKENSEDNIQNVLNVKQAIIKTEMTQSNKGEDRSAQENLEHDKPKKDEEQGNKINENISMHERSLFPPFGIPELPEDSPGSYLKEWQRVAEERGWRSEVIGGRHSLPLEWTKQSKMSRLLNRQPPVQNPRWVVARICDEKLHSYTFPKKCKTEQSGWSLARAISDYLIFLHTKREAERRSNMMLCSPGSAYGVPSGLFFSFPVLSQGDSPFRLIQGYQVSETTFMRINEHVKTLEKEYDLIMKLYQDFPPNFEEPNLASPLSTFAPEEDAETQEMNELDIPFEEGEDEINLEEHLINN